MDCLKEELLYNIRLLLFWLQFKKDINSYNLNINLIIFDILSLFICAMINILFDMLTIAESIKYYYYYTKQILIRGTLLPWEHFDMRR